MPIKNPCKKKLPEIATMYPKMAKPYDTAICQNLSPVRSECHELNSANIVAKAQGGKVSKRVIVVLNPRVAVIVGR